MASSEFTPSIVLAGIACVPKTNEIQAKEWGSPLCPLSECHQQQLTNEYGEVGGKVGLENVPASPAREPKLHGQLMPIASGVGLNRALRKLYAYVNNCAYHCGVDVFYVGE